MSQTLITQFFAADHARLEALFAMIENTIEQDRESAKQYLEAYCDGLAKHTEWEEQVLIPLFQQKVSSEFDPAVHVENDHSEIKRLIIDAIELIAADGPIESTIHALKDLVAHHHRMEEKYFHPMIDREITEQEAAEVFLQCYNLNRWGDVEGA